MSVYLKKGVLMVVGRSGMGLAQGLVSRRALGAAFEVRDQVRTPRKTMSEKSISKEEALGNARRLVQEAVDIATKAGIDPSHVVAPHCAETARAQTAGDGQSSDNLKWCGVSVIIDDRTHELFGMSKPDDDPEQKPAFLVTQSTASLVRQDFERYEPSLERMTEEWQENKNSLFRSEEK